MLSLLATHDFNGFVPGINDLIDGISINANGDTVRTVSYAERIAIGKQSHEALRAYDVARATNDTTAMNKAASELKATFQYFGYGYLDSPAEAIPPVGLTFYSFRVMVIAGGYLLLFLIVYLVIAYKKTSWLTNRWWQWIGMLSLVIVYACSQAGWITAEVGRQPWIIEGLMPTRAAISFISSGMVQLTFWRFAAIFTGLLAAECSIMLKAISKGSKTDYDSLPDSSDEASSSQTAKS